MSAILYMKAGDVDPALMATIKQNGTALNLTGGSVSLVLKNQASGNIIVNRAADLVDAPNGVVKFTFAAGETDIAGVYRGEWVCSVGGREFTAPNNGYFTLEILQRLAA